MKKNETGDDINALVATIAVSAEAMKHGKFLPLLHLCFSVNLFVFFAWISSVVFLGSCRVL